MWNVPPRRILVATDFSDAAAQAARVAGELARAVGAQITAVHAESFEAPPYFTHEQLRAIEHQRANARREAAQYLARTVTHLAGVPVEPTISDGPAVEAILAAAAGHDLVVLGTHGRRGPARWWAGSVAERVARHALVPVLVVRPDTTSAAMLFGNMQMFAGASYPGSSALAYAEQLRGAFEKSAGRDMGTSAAGVTLAVVAQAGTHTSPDSEQALKTCRVPVLVVPDVVGSAANSQ